MNMYTKWKKHEDSYHEKILGQEEKLNMENNS